MHPVCTFCKKPGHVDTSCFVNPNSMSYKGSVPQPAQPVSTVAGGISCLIDGSGEDFQQDDLIEEVINGTVFTVSSDAVTPNNSPYVTVSV